jgi:beta-1,4-mannosyltransferase
MGLPDQGRIFITFGALRGYKGVDTFLDEFRAAANSNDTLLVAGRVLDPSLGDRLAELTRVDPRIRLFEGFLSDSQLACLISAADWVILPYREVLNSGSLLLSLTLRRPAIVPDTPTFREIQSHVGANWVVCSERPLTPQLLTDLGDPPQGAPTLSWCSWARITALLAALW